MPDFVHLHVHSEYSLLDGAIKIPDLIQKVADWGLPAVALTDHGNLFGAIEFYSEAQKHGIKPIIGMEAYLTPGRMTEKPKTGAPNYYHITLLAESLQGYKNLMYLTTQSYLKGFYYKPRIDFDLLREHSEGLIALSGCLKSPIASKLQEGNDDEAIRMAHELVDIFGKDRFYIELMDLGVDENRRINPKLIQLARSLGLKIVATNDVHYLNPDDRIIQDVLLCIQTGKKLADEDRLKIAHMDLYLRPPEEMAELFKDYPEALKNTVEIAERVHLDLDLGTQTLHLPRFDIPEGFEDANAYLAYLARQGLEQRVGSPPPAKYKERLEHELQVIKTLGFSGYFLIIWDIVRKAKEMGIPVGPGRGSAVGSLVLYSLGVTQLDPLQYGLLFERFLNPERVSPPDVDIDFSDVGRDDIIQYVRERFGEDNVSQIITFGKMLSRSVVRDVGRVLGIPYGEVDKLAKMIPQRSDMTLQKALEEVPQLREKMQDPRFQQLLDIAVKVEGHVRNVSTHAAGVVIAPGKIWEYVPLFKNTDGEVSTQYDMKALEKLGLLKVDFLGLRTLTILKWAEELVQRKDPSFRFEDVPLNDRATFDLLSRGDTWGIFQLESQGMTQVVRGVAPDSIEELMAILALYRPGPLESGEVGKYIRRKHGQEPVQYLLPELEPILKETYGVILYQEQVMQIASQIAGFSMSEADQLRRAMGKKKREVMEQQKKIFVERAVQRGVDEAKARELIETIEPFARYGFNKSHAAGYALISYWTAYMKTHYLPEFVTANLSAEMMANDSQKKIGALIKQARRAGLEVLPPDINRSSFRFELLDTGQILYSLGAIKNVGRAAVEAILKERNARGLFKSFEDFLRRTASSKVNKKVIENLIKAGAFDTLEPNRKKLLMILKDQGSNRRTARDAQALFGGSLFGGPETPHEVEPEVEYTLKDRLTYEKEALGFYLTGHPLDAYREVIEALPLTRSSDLEHILDEEEVLMVGILLKVNRRRSRRGNPYLDLKFEDLEDDFDAVYFGREEDLNGGNLVPEKIYFIVGRYARPADGGAGKIRIEHLIPFETGLKRAVKGVILEVSLDQSDELVQRLPELTFEFPGTTPLIFRIQGVGNFISKNTRVTPHVKFFRELRKLLGENRVRMVLNRSAFVPSTQGGF